MTVHTHTFVEQYQGLVGFGYDRETNEQTIKYYLQKFSDDQNMQALIPRLSDNELEELFSLINRYMKNHFSESEYHEFFLKNKH